MDIYLLIAIAILGGAAFGLVVVLLTDPGDPPPPPPFDGARGYLVHHGNLVETEDLL